MSVALLKNLLIAIIVIAIVGLSGIIWPFQDNEPEAVLKRLGARFSYTLSEIPVSAQCEGNTFGDDEVAILVKLASVQRVSLADSRVTRRGLESLRNLKHLVSLDLSRTRLTGEALDIIASLSTLTELRFEGCNWLQGEHLEQITSLKRLNRLDLSETAVKAEGLLHLQCVTSPFQLILDRCPQIGDDSIQHLAKLTNLTQLNLSGCEFTSSGISRLRECLPHTTVMITTESLVDLRKFSHLGMFALSRSGKVGSFRRTAEFDAVSNSLQPGDLARISSYTDLAEIALSGHITDEMLLEIGPLPNLEYLYLVDTVITDEGLRCLKSFPHLKHLAIVHTEFAGPGLEYLAFAPELKRLEIQSRRGDEMLRHLPPLSHLEDLVVRAPVTDAGLSYLSNQQRLRSLCLNDSKVRGDGLHQLSGLSDLTTLLFNAGVLDDSGLKVLERFEALRYVSLQNTHVTGAGASQLSASIPGIKVVLNGNRIAPASKPPDEKGHANRG